MEKINNYWVLVICQTVYTIGFTEKHSSLRRVYYFPCFTGDDVQCAVFTCPRMNDEERKQNATLCLSSLPSQSLGVGGVFKLCLILGHFLRGAVEGPELRCFGPYHGVLPGAKSLCNNKWLPRRTCHLGLFFIILVQEPLGICSQEILGNDNCQT